MKLPHIYSRVPAKPVMQRNAWINWKNKSTKLDMIMVSLVRYASFKAAVSFELIRQKNHYSLHDC